MWIVSTFLATMYNTVTNIHVQVFVWYFVPYFHNIHVKIFENVGHNEEWNFWVITMFNLLKNCFPKQPHHCTCPQQYMSVAFYGHLSISCFLKKTLRSLQNEASTDYSGELPRGITEFLFMHTLPTTIPTVGTVQLKNV